MIPTSTISVVVYERLLFFVNDNDYKLTSVKILAEITCALITFNIYRFILKCNIMRVRIGFNIKKLKLP